MIRTGIFNISQLEKSSLTDLFGKEKNISIYLYKKIMQIDDVHKKVKYADVILNRFNSDRNVIKRTYRNRFDTFDNETIIKISEQNYERVSVLDVAISDGRASCYFLEQSINQLKDLSYTGTDLNINYYLNKRNSKSKSYIITDENKKIIEISYPPFVWNLARTEGRFYFINNFLKNIFIKRTQKELLDNQYEYKEKIELLHPDLKYLLSQNKGFELKNCDLYDEIPAKYTVIRAMNILHSGYFSKDQMWIILNNIYNGLEINGLFIEGSNENAGTSVEGAIYFKSVKGFILLSEPENPSRIKDMVLSFRESTKNGH